MLKVGRNTLSYIVREEQKDKLKERAGMRARKYEKKLEKGGCGELARTCWEEIKKREKRDVARGEEERKQFMEERS